MIQPWDAPEASASRAAVNLSYQYFRFYQDVVDECVQVKSLRDPRVSKRREMSSIVRSVMISAEEPQAVAYWWAGLLEWPIDRASFEDGCVWFDVGDTEFGFHPADARKNPVGGRRVVSLRVEDLAVAQAESRGARLHRGPLAIGASRSIAQQANPFGNVFGLDGSLGH